MSFISRILLQSNEGMFGDLRISPAHIPQHFLANVASINDVDPANDDDAAEAVLNISEMYKPDDEEFKSQYNNTHPIRPTFDYKIISRMICVENFNNTNVSVVFVNSDVYTRWIYKFIDLLFHRESKPRSLFEKPSTITVKSKTFGWSIWVTVTMALKMLKTAGLMFYSGSSYPLPGMCHYPIGLSLG